MILSVFGPTASGKSALGLKLAKDLNAEIINCDSVQLYKGFVIGAAQPSLQDKLQVNHHLFEEITPTDTMSVGKYSKLANGYIEKIQSDQKLPLIVGGTSLYLIGLLYGLADLEQDDSIRQQLESIPNEQLYKELQNLDPQAASKIHNNDRQRLLRAVEVGRLGNKISQSHADHKQQQLIHDCLIIVPVWDRKTLYDRIDQRTKIMFDQGLIDEANQLAKLYPGSEPLGSIGYKEVLEHDQNDTNFLIEQVAQNTRRFAKRQLTWLRNEPQKRNWNIRPDASLNDPVLSLVGDLTSFAKPKNIKHIECLDWDYSKLVHEIALFLHNKPPKGVFIWFVTAQKVV